MMLNTVSSGTPEGRRAHAGLRLLFAGVCLLTVAGARADVWQDCRAWYSGAGGKCAAGQLKDGTMLDIRHAADPDASTHGGGLRCYTKSVSNVIQSVMCPTSGETLENQCVTYLPQSEKIDSGAYKIYESGIKVPISVETNEYTVLLRVKFNETQQTNVTEHGFLDMGYNYTAKQSFNVRVTDDETIQICCRPSGSDPTKKTVSPTNDVTRSLFGTWMDLAVQMSNGTIRVGALVPGLKSMKWLSYTGKFAAVSNQIPQNGLFYLGGYTRNNGWSVKSNAARANYHLVAYWDRVLAQEEIDEAFSWPKTMSVLRVGGDGYGSEMFRGATTGAVTDVSACLENPDEVASFPAALEAGRTLKFDFTVPETATNLAQVLRLAAASASGAGTIDCRLDGTSLGTAAVASGETVRLFVPAAKMTGGVHALELVRTDAGAQSVRFDLVDLSGSWRIGYPGGLPGDIYKFAGAKRYDVFNLTTNRWQYLQSCGTMTRYPEFHVRVDSHDALNRRFVFRAMPCRGPKNTFDLVVLLNGVEKGRQAWDSDISYQLLKASFKPGDLLPGENVIRVMSDPREGYAVPQQSWMNYSFFSLEVGAEPSGFSLFVK